MNAMTARRFLAAAVAAALLATFLSTRAKADDPESPKLPAKSLFEQLAGNTLTGYNTSGVNFTEYHSPDGRVFGFNNGVPTTNACWRTAGLNAICYYYDKGGDTRKEVCWRFEAFGDVGYKFFSLNSSTHGIARWEAGDPHGLIDQKQNWTCDALMASLRPGIQPIAFVPKRISP